MLNLKTAQKMFLDKVREARARGQTKGVLIFPTGLGKTYASLVDALEFTKEGGRILVLAHNTEILKQLASDMQNLTQNRSVGFLFSESKQTDTDVIFANIKTMVQDKWLYSFRPDAFAYIIVDETHHVAAASWKRIVEYFKPRFLLGMTATPNRTDKIDIFATYDNNIILDIPLHEALSRNWLRPLKYVFLYDKWCDYRNIPHKVVNGGYARYAAEEVGKRYSVPERDRAIVSAYKKYAEDRKGVGFCVSVKESKRMADLFNRNGIPSAIVTGKMKVSRRTKIINDYKEGKYKLLFNCDVIGEGVHLPGVDVVLKLRPTYSPIKDQQQNGRGLINIEGLDSSEYTQLLILDFVGNYKNAYMNYIRLGNRSLDPVDRTRINKFIRLPIGTDVVFEEKVIDLFNHQLKYGNTYTRDEIKNMFTDYLLIHKRTPTFEQYLDYLNLSEKSFKRLFTSYEEFLKEIGVHLPSGASQEKIVEDLEGIGIFDKLKKVLVELKKPENDDFYLRAVHEYFREPPIPIKSIAEMTGIGEFKLKTLYHRLSLPINYHKRVAVYLENRKRKIISSWLELRSVELVAKKMGVSKEAVRARFKKWQINIKIGESARVRLYPIREQIIREYESKIPIGIILAKYHVNIGTLVPLLREWGAKIRKKEPTPYESILNDYHNGLKIIELMEKYRLSYETIYNLLRKKGISFRPQSEQERMLAIRYYFEKNASIDQIARRLGITTTQVYNYLRRFTNLERKPISQSTQEAIMKFWNSTVMFSSKKQLSVRISGGRHGAASIKKRIFLDRSSDAAKLKSLSERFEMDPRIITYFLKSRGIILTQTLRGYYNTPENIEKIRKYRAQGFGIDRISKWLGIPYAITVKLTRDNKIPFLSQKTPQKTRDEVIKAYIAGAGNRELIIKFGLHPSTLRNIIVKSGVKRTIDMEKKAAEETIILKNYKKKTLTELAIMLNTSINNVRTKVNRLGLRRYYFLRQQKIQKLKKR